MDEIGAKLGQIGELWGAEIPSPTTENYAWFVGATSESKDFVDEMIDEGRWENMHDVMFHDLVNEIKVGDKIVLKAAYTKKYGLPFNNNGKTVAVMGIKAIGVVTKNMLDGKQIEVDWERLPTVKEWYGQGVLRQTLHLVKSTDGTIKKQLLEFVFGDKSQDYSICEEHYSDNPADEPDGESAKEVIIDKNNNKKTAVELANELAKMYASDDSSSKTTAIHMFGLKYADELEASDINKKEILKLAGMSESYETEINKGIRINKSIAANEFGVKFYEGDEVDHGVLSTSFDWAAYIPTDNLPHNKIVFGAPGTGKSHGVNQKVKDGKENVFDERYERVTFHPDYTYANFVGAYKPVSVNDEIKYEYVPGPFMTTFVKAVKSLLSDTPERFLLIIEEVNRANMAAVFGDIFQLLDRNADHVSEYSITTTQDMRKYLMKELNCTEDAVKEIKIPNNMYIWATMNSADQGVFPMDTAFKRRWNFEYLDIDEGEDGMKQYAFDIIVGKEIHTINWNKLRHAINNRLTDMGVNEDKLLGPYFIAKSVMEGDNDGFIDAFKNKVLMYLYEDAAKHKRDRIFVTDVSGNTNKRYSQILKNFDNYGLDIFAGNSFDDAVVENKPIDSADGIEA